VLPLIAVVGRWCAPPARRRATIRAISGDHPANLRAVVCVPEGAALGETIDLDGRFYSPRSASPKLMGNGGLILVARKFSEAIAEHRPPTSVGPSNASVKN